MLLDALIYIVAVFIAAQVLILVPFEIAFCVVSLVFVAVLLANEGSKMQHIAYFQIGLIFLKLIGVLPIDWVQALIPFWMLLITFVICVFFDALFRG